MKVWQLWKQDTWVKPFLRKYKKMLLLAVCLGFFTFFCGAALMFNSGFLISRAASLPENILLIYIPVVLTRAFGLLRPIFRYVERLTSHNWVLKMTSSLRKKLYLSLEKEGIFLVEKFRLGDLLGLLSEDIGHLQNLYLRSIFPMLIALCLYVFLVVSSGFFSVFFALGILLLFFVITVLFPVVSLLKMGALQESMKFLRNELYTTLTDNVLGVSDWIFSGRVHDFLTHYDEKERVLRQKQQKMNQGIRVRNLLMELFFGVIVLATLFWAAQTFGQTKQSANWIAAFVLCIFPLIDAFSPLSEATVEMNRYADSVKRLNQLPDVNKVQEITEKSAPHSLVLHLKDVHFRYKQDEKEVLRGIHLHIKEGEKIALLGKSGSGKSTLARLIRGDLVANQGKILLGDVPVASLKTTIHEHIGVIHQTPYLFHTTLLNNLRIGNEKATEEEVWQVLEVVGLKEMVARLPEKLQTMVDEEGLRFSGGERQRIALARIVLSDVKIVLLDEPTIGLDPITENQLLTNFFEALKGKTIFWITHHLLGIEKMDRVIFLEEGKISLQGTPKELYETNTYFQRLQGLDRGW